MADDKGRNATKVWTIDVQIAATAYVKAATAEEAIEKVKKLENEHLQFLRQGEDDPPDVDPLPISGRSLGDPNLPPVSLSPAMMFCGMWPDATPQLAWEEEN